MKVDISWGKEIRQGIKRDGEKENSMSDIPCSLSLSLSFPSLSCTWNSAREWEGRSYDFILNTTAHLTQYLQNRSIHVWTFIVWTWRDVEEGREGNETKDPTTKSAGIDVEHEDYVSGSFLLSHIFHPTLHVFLSKEKRHLRLGFVLLLLLNWGGCSLYSPLFDVFRFGSFSCCFAALHGTVLSCDKFSLPILSDALLCLNKVNKCGRLLLPCFSLSLSLSAMKNTVKRSKDINCESIVHAKHSFLIHGQTSLWS